MNSIFHYLECVASVQQMHINLIVMRRVIEFKQLIFVAESKGHKQTAFSSDDNGNII